MLLIYKSNVAGHSKTVKLEELKPATRIADGVKESNNLLSLSKKLKVS